MIQTRSYVPLTPNLHLLPQLPMGSPNTAVIYLCVLKGNRLMYRYTSGDQEVDRMATICLENIPTYHTWYFETCSKRKFGFLLGNSVVFFTIVDIRLLSSSVLQFLHQFRDEYLRVSKGSLSSPTTFSPQEQILPFLTKSIHSLSQSIEWAPIMPSYSLPPIISACSTEPSSSSKVPLLKESELQEERTEPSGVGSGQATEGLRSSPQKEFVLMRSRSGSQMMRRRWCKQVRIILGIDAVVCLVLLGVWLGICRGLQCTR